MKVKWKDMPVTQKIAKIVLGSAAVFALVFLVLDIFNVMEDSVKFSMAFLGVEILSNAYLVWNEKRTIAYICIGAAVILFLSLFVVLFV
ncbi:MAG: hypothetical protein E7557_02595 [Ruminococcaceae bacterium]|nr:hypothetical protein [Oscillospiraceae bacterium]